MDEWLRSHLVCPQDHTALRLERETLVCAEGHTYPYVDGIPVMLVPDVPPTHAAFHETRLRIREGTTGAQAAVVPGSGGVDPYVQDAVAGTCGYMYRGMVGRLTAYPIPELRLPRGSGQRLLDVGCNWGRWCISAARHGYAPVGIDPSLNAITGARRVAAQLGVPASYLVADARHLPFAAGSFDVAFSYSVLQHFEKAEAIRAFEEIARVLTTSGTAMVQMPNVFGARNLYHQCRRGLRQAIAFEVRYWRPRELQQAFERAVGPTALSVDGYFSLNPQASDRELLPRSLHAVVSCSERLRALSERMPWLVALADSLYVTSVRRGAPTEAHPRQGTTPS